VIVLLLSRQEGGGIVELCESEEKLDIRQRKFVAYLVEGMNQTDAAIAAGYSAKTARAQAHNILKRPKIAAYRRALTIAIFEQLGLTEESIAMRLFEIYERCMQKEPVMVWDSDTKEWVESGMWKFDAKGAIRVLELLGKNAGMFTERVDLSGEATFKVSLECGVNEAGK
jgi:phage terminase small subunit